MAEINKLSVGKLLDKLRGKKDEPKSKVTRLDDKIDTIDEEMQRLRAMRRRLDGDNSAG
jgi:chaperonin cofactor prefoldin